MNKLDFFTPVRYDEQEKNIKHQIFEGIEDYFFLGGKKAYVIPGKIVDGNQEVELKCRPESKTKKLILGAIKVASYMTGFIPLIMGVAKAIFRATHKFHTIPTVKLLQEGIDIKDETVSKIQSCMENILKKKTGDGVHFYNSGDNHRVFSLDTAPGLVFKMKAHKYIQEVLRDDSIKARYQSIIKAKTVCRTHELGLLFIPNAKLFTVQVDGEDYDIIAQQKVNIDTDKSAQEKHFEDYADSLTEAVRQLAVLIARTGFSDVEWRNIPVLNDSLDENGNRKITLIDLEHMDGAKKGLFGGPNRRGLIRCVNEKQIDIVIEEARKHGVVDDNKAGIAKTIRLRELEFCKQLKQFYRKKGVVTGKEPIQVDINSLGLDLTEEDQIDVFTGFKDGKRQGRKETVTMNRAINDVITEINTQIQGSSNQKSVKGKRDLLIDTNGYPFAYYNQCKSKKEEQSWLDRIVQALVNKGHIFTLVEKNGHGYFIQA